MHARIKVMVTYSLRGYQTVAARHAGKQLDDFAVWQPCPESHDTHVTPDLTLRPVRSRHGELCFGAVFKWKGKHVLGWSVSGGRWRTEIKH